MRSILRRFQFGPQRAGRPPAVVEITPRGILAAALPKDRREPLFAFEPLAEGIVVPSITKTNLLAPKLVSAAISAALQKVSPQIRNVTLLLPDLSIRVFLVDFDSLPSQHSAAMSILRFRLRKVVPFDVEIARVSYQILSQNEKGCRVLVAVIPGSILSEYESALLTTEYRAGVVLSSGLAALAALDSPDPALAACLSDRSLTTSITKDNDLLLYRTLDLAEESELKLAETRRDIAVAAAYFEDRLANRPARLHYAGVGSAEAFARDLASPDLTVVDLSPWPETETQMPQGNMGVASVVGALAGAR
jgi:type IV pilus assembly protein PilM